MNILAVDDEHRGLNMLIRAISQAEPDAMLTGFQNPFDALAFAEDHLIDTAFLDAKMPGLSGLDLAVTLKERHPKINIIFVTGYNEYAVDALALYASGYVLKPIRADQVAEQLANLRHPVMTEKLVRIQCFGSFGVFVNDKPLIFTRAKVKELLAYLVHKQGAMMTNAMLAAALLGYDTNQESEKAYMRQIVSRLLKLLREMEIEDVIKKGRGGIAIDTTKISCDYYDYLMDRKRFMHTFKGEYMSDYSWAEPTLAYIIAHQEL